MPVYPAGLTEEVVAVASASLQGKSDFSNYGNYVDICADGTREQLQTYFPGQSFQRYRFYGTSFAAPRVTGVLAALMLQDENLTPRAAMTIIVRLLKQLIVFIFVQGNWELVCLPGGRLWLR